MSQAHRPPAGQARNRAASLTPPKAKQVRNSTQRADRIRQYIHGLLPAHITSKVDVVITEGVETAAVLPATEDALVNDEQTEFDRQQAKNLIAQVDGEFLVLVTGRETPTDPIPLEDQLTADVAKQLALAFHETLHILKTSFGPVSQLVSQEVEDQYEDYVHNLINLTEDGAIEHEAITGDDFSDRAATRLKLAREIFSRGPGDFEGLPENQRTFTLGDAIQKALHDRIIYNTGTTDVLLDEDNPLLSFSTNEERKAFEQVHDDIESLRDDILSLRGDENTALHKNNKEASIRRAKRTIEFWKDVLKPIVEGDAQTGQSHSEENQSGSGSEESENASNGMEADSNSETMDNSPESIEPGDDSKGSEGASDGMDSNPEDSNNASSSMEAGSDSKESESDSKSTEGSQRGPDAGNPSPEIDPDELSLEPNAVENPHQSVRDHPSIDDEPDLEDVDLSPESLEQAGGNEGETESPQQPDNHQSETGEQSNQESSASGADQGGDADGHHPTGDGNAESSEETAETEPSSADGSAGPDAQPGDTGSDAGEQESNSTTVTTTSSSPTPDPFTSSEPEQQATFGDFAKDGSESSETSDTHETHRTPETPETTGTSETTEAEGGDRDNSSTEDDEADSASGPTDEAGDTERSAGDHESRAELDGRKPGGAGTENEISSSDSQRETANQPSDDPASDSDPGDDATSGGETNPHQSTPSSREQEDGQSNTPEGPAHDDSELDESDFESDRRQAERTAAESTIDEQAMDEDLEQIDEALRREQDTGPANEQGGNGAGPGSVDELTILPTPSSHHRQDIQWETIENASATVADTLAKQLRLDQMTSQRNGLSSGTTVNQKTAYRLGYGDPRVFSETLPGDEKDYFIVLVLDRSGSMGPGYRERNSDMPSKIKVASEAVARFATACEALEIDVAVVDFYDDEARLVKPPSVKTEFAQESILNTEAGGMTPLADTLALARSLTESNPKESIIISITDDKPDDVDAVAKQIKTSFAPVCSLTIATDCDRGNPPAQAEELERKYDQTTTVFEPEGLDSRLDELASLLGSY